MAGLTNIRRALTPRPPPPDIAEGRRSRALYALGEANWVTVDQLSTNTYLAALMLHLGFADGDIGTVMALSALVCVIQLLTLGRGGHYRGKRMVVAITSAQRLWMAFMYFIPFLPVSSTLKMVLLGGIYFLSRAAISFGGPASSEWVAQLTPMRIRGRYLGAKDATSVAVQAVVLLAAGMVLDANKASTPLRSFAILGLMVTGLCALGFTAYMFTEDRHSPKVDRAAPSESIGAQLARCLGDRSFRIVLTLDCLWQITYYIACPYNASYSIKEMSLSFTFMSVVGFAGNIARIFIARKMGAWADRTSMAKVLRFSILLLGLHYITWTLMRSSVAYWMYILMALLSTTAWSFIGVGLFGVKLELMPEGQRQVQFAVTAALSGVVGFAMSFLSGRLLALLQAQQMVLGGMTIYPQQILNLLGVVCTAIMYFYLKRVVEANENAARAANE